MSRDSITATDPLDHAFANLATAGWRIQYRTPTTMQLVKPKHFKTTEGVLLGLVCLGLVLLGGVTGILLAMLLALGDFIWYAARRDETMVVAQGADGSVRQVGASAPAHLLCICGHSIRLHVHEQDQCAAAGLTKACGCQHFQAATV